MDERAAAFWARVDASGDCWVWTGSRGDHGYGTFFGVSNTHRYAWELLVGPIEPGLHLDHLCRNRACVNPDHLDPVPPRVNAHRSPIHPVNRTHCANGHPFDEANTYVRRDTGHRQCRTCHRISERRRRKARSND